MNRQTIGRILAAASVVLSLIFVGYEIRQSTKVARQEAYYAFMQAYVLHHVQSAVWPDVPGTALRRTFEFDGPDRLTLSEDPAGLIPPEAGSVLVWDRLE